MSKLFDMFVGEYVRFIMKRDEKGNIQDDKGNIRLLQQAMTVQGYLFEEDDDYFYLAYQPNAEYISIAVTKKEIVTTELIDPTEDENKMAQMLDDSVGPEDSGVN